MIYLIRNKDTNWGDWSDVLWSGFAPHDEESNLVYVERSGPFVPAIYEADGNLIFTDKAKECYNTYFPNSLIFPYTLEKRKIVNIDWQSWNKDEFYNKVIEEVSEPEDIIENSLHDDEIATSIGSLWLAKTTVSIHLEVQKNSKSENPSDFIFLQNSPQQEWHFMEGIEYKAYFIGSKVKKWLDDNFPECFEVYLITEFKEK